MWILLWLLACGGPRIHHQVELADLAPLGEADLATLRDEEHALSVARTRLAGAQAELERASGRVELAKETIVRSEVDYRAAEAAYEAVRMRGDPVSIGAAAGRVEVAARRLSRARARLDWRDATREVAREAVAVAERRVLLAQASLELARYELVAPRSRGLGYLRSDFVEQLKKAQRAHDAAEVSLDAAARDAAEAWSRLRRIPR